MAFFEMGKIIELMTLLRYQPTPSVKRRTADSTLPSVGRESKEASNYPRTRESVKSNIHTGKYGRTLPCEPERKRAKVTRAERAAQLGAGSVFSLAATLKGYPTDNALVGCYVLGKTLGRSADLKVKNETLFYTSAADLAYME
ncbi:hypothetical protein EVAR_100078_1 [Eumeta japonica]|uniref:Uncharacterized protein n=1 Tax=Eumeta variegata TaxID=151549 RepID=A0A4C1YUN2_EUMVA|nr:hypothetical protein EVAR_100078_1 [Eumeta japonica]